jgi:hypothetical protein
MVAPIGMILGSINYNKGTINNKGLLGAGIGLGVLLLVLQLVLYKVFSIFTAPFIRAFGYEFKGVDNEKEMFGELMKQIKSYANHR